MALSGGWAAVVGDPLRDGGVDRQRKSSRQGAPGARGGQGTGVHCVCCARVCEFVQCFCTSREATVKKQECTLNGAGVAEANICLMGARELPERLLVLMVKKLERKGSGFLVVGVVLVLVLRLLALILPGMC